MSTPVDRTKTAQSYYTNLEGSTHAIKIKGEGKLVKALNFTNKEIFRRMAAPLAGLTGSLQAGFSTAAKGTEDLIGGALTLDKKQAKRGGKKFLEAGYHGATLLGLGALGILSPKKAGKKARDVQTFIQGHQKFFANESKDVYPAKRARVMSPVRGLRYGVLHGAGGLNAIFNAPFSGKAWSNVKNGGKGCWRGVKLAGHGFAGIVRTKSREKINIRAEQPRTQSA
jgi:hypothetical protein